MFLKNKVPADSDIKECELKTATVKGSNVCRIYYAASINQRGTNEFTQSWIAVDPSNYGLEEDDNTDEDKIRI